MKKLLLISTLAVLTICNCYRVDAQVRININIGNQPVWGPIGYDYAQYYYMPDIDAYYYIPERQFIYLEGNQWIFAPSLPASYHYDLYRGYKVIINDPRPYLHPDVYRRRYGRYKGWYGRQTIIRDSREEKYYKVKGHPMNGKGNWKKYNDDNDREDNKGKGHGRGRGHD